MKQADELSYSQALPVLVVDDEPHVLHGCSLMLRMDGIKEVICCEDARRVPGILAGRDVGVILLDLLMPTMPGEELLAQLAEDYPHIPVIVVTSSNTIETAVECMRMGAFDYMVKPIERNRLLSGIERALEVVELRRACQVLTQRLLSPTLEHPEAFSAMVTGHPAMFALFRCIEAISPTSKPVLITGETGTGKELVARTIHSLSGRKGAFVAVNVAGLDDALFADTLFGHRRGAFTGAEKDHPGLIEKAAGGTLFLDEIGDLSAGAQVKLLRLIQEHEYLPLGSNVAARSDARVLAATHQDLTRAQKEGRFRKDLYYRLQYHHVHVPPLRERKEDIPLLVHDMAKKAAEALGHGKPPPVPKELFDLLFTYSFPGNVRELDTIVFDAVSMHRAGVLSTEVFRQRIEAGESQASPSYIDPSGAGEAPFASWMRLPSLDDADRLLVEEALRRANGNQTVAARLLGISQPALSKRLKRAGS